MLVSPSISYGYESVPHTTGFVLLLYLVSEVHYYTTTQPTRIDFSGLSSCAPARHPHSYHLHVLVTVRPAHRAHVVLNGSRGARNSVVTHVEIVLDGGVPIGRRRYGARAVDLKSALDGLLVLPDPPDPVHVAVV